MALPLRRLAGLLVLAASFGCPKAVNAPQAAIGTVGSGVQIGQVVRLDGTGSSDPQGRDLSYAWQFTQIPVGSTAALNDAHSATPSFLADVNGEFDVQLVVSNAFLSSPAQTVKVNVSQCGGRAPVFGNSAVTAKDAANASISNNFAVGATITLSSDVSDPDNSVTDSVCSTSQNQAVSYLWKLVGQPAASAATLNNPTASSPSFVADVAGTYTVRLVATDSTNRSSVPFDQTFTVSSCGANAPTIASVAPVTEQLAVGKTIQLTATPADADNGTTCQTVLPGPQTFSFAWSLPVLPNGSHAALNSTNAQNPSFTPDIDGDYTVRLVVSDSTGRSSAPSDTAIHITKCGNNAPVASITGATGGAAPSTGFLGGLIQFGETVTDADGPVNGGAAPGTPACSPTIPQSVSLHWSILALPAGSQAALNNPTGTNPSFTPDVAGAYTVQLVAVDQSGLASAPATQSVVASSCGRNPPTIAFTPPATTVYNAGNGVSLTANVTNNDSACLAGETYTYNWSLASKPANSNAFTTAAAPSGNSDTASFTADVPNGTYQVRLVVTSSAGVSSAPAFFSFNTNGCGTNAPAITTGTTGADNSSPNVGFDTVTLTAHATDADNTTACTPALGTAGQLPQQTLAFQWSVVSRPSGSGAALNVTATDGSVATFKPDVIGPYQFSVVVTDSTGLSSAPTFVTVGTSGCGSNAPKITSPSAVSAGHTPPWPTVDAMTLSATVTDADDGISGCFPGGQKQTYAWSVVSRPAGSSAVISNATSLTASFTPDVPGDFQFRLDVTDSLGLQAAPAFVNVSASTCSLVAPAVAAFTAQSGTQFNAFSFPAPGVTNNNCLASSSQYGYQWAVVSAPAGSAATLSNPAVASPLFTPDKTGDYQFSLVVTNTQGIASTPVFLNLDAAGCGNAQLGWGTPPAVTQVVDPDLGTVTSGALLTAPNVGGQVQVHAVASDPNAACKSGPVDHTLPFSYQWAIVAAPSGSHATLTSSTDLFPSFVPDKQGTYQLSVVATDALGNVSAAPAFVSVSTSNCGANVPRVAINPNDLSGGILSMTPTALAVAAGFPQNDDTALCPTRFHVAPTAYTYAWTVSSQPSNGRATLTNAGGASTSLEAFTTGNYQVHLVATTPAGISSDPAAAASFVAIHANSCGSSAPLINSVSTFAAPADTTVLSRPRVGLDAVDLVANATDPDTACGDGAASVTGYEWTAISLPSGSGVKTSASGASPKFTFTPDVAGTYVFSVVATDDTLLQSAPVQVTINTAACAPTFAGIQATGPSGLLTPTSANSVSSATFDALTLNVASVSDTCVQQPTFAYAWTLTQKPADSQATLSSLSSTSTAVTPDVPGVYVAQLVITDNAGLSSGPATLTLDVANCGAVKPAIGSLASSAAHTPPNAGDLVTLAANALQDANVSTCAAANRYTGNGVLKVFATSLSSPSVFVNNVLQTSGYSVAAGNVTFTAAPANGAAIAFSSITFGYQWSLISVPTSSASQLSSTSAPGPQFVTDLPNGTYQVALSITDSLGNVSAPAFLPVTSSACGANPPAFTSLPNVSGNANSPIAITWSTSDADTGVACGLSTAVTSVAWSVVSAPAGAHPVVTSSVTTGGASSGTVTNSFQADKAGSYVVRATAFASNGLSTSQTFTVTVSGCGTNAPVITNLAISDSGGTVSRPQVPDVVTITASHTDADEGLCGDTQHYAFTLVSTPSGSAAAVSQTLATDNHANLNVDVAGNYVVSVTATDSFGNQSSPSSVTIATGTCGPTIGNAPTFATPIGTSPASVTAGNTVTLSSGAFNTDNCVSGGATQTRQWSFISRPSGSGAVISNATAQNASFITDVPGLYAVQLVITDNGGFSTVYTATVNAGACTAGPSITNTTGQPIATSSLFSATDIDPTDGAIVSSQAIFAGDRVQLSLPASGSGVGGLAAGACSSALNYDWSLISRPAASGAQLSSSSASSPAFVPDQPGNYQFAVVVRDGLGNANTVTSSSGTSVTPFFFTLNVSDCGFRAPSLTGTVSADPAARANLAFNVTSSAATDPNNNGLHTAANALCPSRFHHGTFSYAFSILSQPAGANGVFSGSGSTQQLLVKQGGAGAFNVKVVATADSGLSSAALTSGAFSVSNCGANPPVVDQFVIQQSLAGGSGLGINVNSGASAGSIFNLVPLTVQIPNGHINDADATCGAPADATSVSYAWTMSPPAGSHTTLGGSNTGTVAFTPDVAGTYQLSLTTTDNVGYSSTATMSFDANCGNNPPSGLVTSATQASSGRSAPSLLTVGSAVSLNVNANDTDATTGCSAANVVEAQPFTYQWTMTQVPPGSSATLLAANTQQPSFVPDVTGQYIVQATVTDPQGHSATGTALTIDVECGTTPPSATELFANQTLTVNGSTTLNIQHASNPADDSASPAPAGGGTVQFYPRVPVTLSANVPNPVTQQPSPACATQPDVISYHWAVTQQPAGSTAAILNPTAQRPSFTPDRPGDYAFSLTVTDQNGRSTSSALTLSGSPRNVGGCGTNAPTVVATFSGTTTAGQLVQLDATGSQSSDDYRTTAYPTLVGTVPACGLTENLTYQWQIVAAPAGSTAQLTSTTLINPAFTANPSGNYTVQVTVSDGVNSASKVLDIIGAAQPGMAGGLVFTATSNGGGTGQPVTAFWDNTLGTLGAAQCTANCTSGTPTWKQLGTIDDGLGQMSFAPADEPRPVAALVSTDPSHNIFVAYYTGHQTGAATSTNIGNMPFCSLVLATYTGGITWSRQLVATGSGCDANVYGSGTQSGRYVSMTQSSAGVPMIGYFHQNSASISDAKFRACTGVDCATLSSEVSIQPSGTKLGRWVSIAASPTGGVHATWYFDGGQQLVYSFSPSFTAPSFNFAFPDAATDTGRFTSLAYVAPTSGNGLTSPLLVTVYRNNTTSQAKVAACSETAAGSCQNGSSVWSNAVVSDPGGSANYGRDTVISVDGNGLPRVAYYDIANNLVRTLQGTGPLANPPVFTGVSAFGGANSSPVGLSAAFGTTANSLFVGYASATGPQFFAGP